MNIRNRHLLDYLEKRRNHPDYNLETTNKFFKQLETLELLFEEEEKLQNLINSDPLYTSINNSINFLNINMQQNLCNHFQYLLVTIRDPNDPIICEAITDLQNIVSITLQVHTFLNINHDAAIIINNLKTKIQTYQREISQINQNTINNQLKKFVLILKNKNNYDANTLNEIDTALSRGWCAGWIALNGYAYLLSQQPRNQNILDSQDESWVITVKMLISSWDGKEESLTQQEFKDIEKFLQDVYFSQSIHKFLYTSTQPDLQTILEDWHFKNRRIQREFDFVLPMNSIGMQKLLSAVLLIPDSENKIFSLNLRTIGHALRIRKLGNDFYLDDPNFEYGERKFPSIGTLVHKIFDLYNIAYHSEILAALTVYDFDTSPRTVYPDQLALHDQIYTGNTSIAPADCLLFAIFNKSPASFDFLFKHFDPTQYDVNNLFLCAIVVNTPQIAERVLSYISSENIQKGMNYSIVNSLIDCIKLLLPLIPSEKYPNLIEQAISTLSKEAVTLVSSILTNSQKYDAIVFAATNNHALMIPAIIETLTSEQKINFLYDYKKSSALNNTIKKIIISAFPKQPTKPSKIGSRIFSERSEDLNSSEEQLDFPTPSMKKKRPNGI